MKHIFFVLLILPFALISAPCTLTPFCRSASEIEAILDSDDLQEALGTTKQITAILRNEKGWLVKNDAYQVQVHVKYDYSGRLGPVNFNLSFDKPQKTSP